MNYGTYYCSSLGLCKYCRTGFECVVKWLWMALYKPDCDCNDCELLSGQATPSSSSAILRHERHVVLLLFTLLAWFPNFSCSNAAVTVWFTSLRTFGDSCAWLVVGRFTFDLKYQWILISMINSWMWLYCTVQMRAHVDRLSKRGEVICNVIHCIFFSCDSLIARYGKTRNSQSKESCDQNPSYGSLTH